jgi:hypothetical protein
MDVSRHDRDRDRDHDRDHDRHCHDGRRDNRHRRDDHPDRGDRRGRGADDGLRDVRALDDDRCHRPGPNRAHCAHPTKDACPPLLTTNSVTIGAMCNDHLYRLQ